MFSNSYCETKNNSLILLRITCQRVTTITFRSVRITFVSLAVNSHEDNVKVGITTPKVPLKLFDITLIKDIELSQIDLYALLN